MISKLTPEMRLLCPAKGFVYVWQMPTRFSHWVNVISILVLSISGLYIHYPFFSYDNALTQPYVMGTVRYVHYLFAMIFMFSVLLRVVYVIVGNEYENYKTFCNPFKKKDRDLLIQYLKYYTFLEKKPQHTLTHNPMAQYAYIAIFFVFFFQILSGLYLWSLNNPNGTLYAMVSWLSVIGNVQYIRMAHYFVVYLICTFLVVHLYAAVLVDFRTHSGDISSIFSGWKADV
jgi:Ni/Fe-hydrogenase 1 B-type cytochrome subunit